MVNPNPNPSPEASCQKLQSYIEREHFRGHDPYDALNSPIISGLSLGNKFLRIAFIQLLKRLPVNLRPLLLVNKDCNPKGLGLLLWGYAKLYAREKDPRYLEQIDKLLELLEGLKSRDCSGNGWGYNFDWQSRAFFVPKGTPTVVNSSFIGHALLDTWQMTGNKRAMDMALPIADFILRDLNRHEEDDAVCFSYTPLDRYFVHNANLLGASLLIRIYSLLKEEPAAPAASLSVVNSAPRFPGQRKGEADALRNEAENGRIFSGILEEMRETALAALVYSMRHQRDDGSWYYAEKEGAHWVDSFHTGFNLQAVRYFLDAGFCEVWRERYERGVQFYRDRFFLADGTPKYYHDRTYPIDIHAPAQAVVFFSRMGPDYAELTRRILEWMIVNMQAPKGLFYFQKHRWYTNRIPYMRWGQAWAFHAMTEYLLHHDD